MDTKRLFPVLAFFLVVTAISFATAAFVNSAPPGFGNSGSSGFFGGNSYQAYQPSFNQLYRGGTSAGLGDIWPILKNLENDQCEAATDFVIGISPAGCQPMVVRSDLLAEQPVPVFCELYAIKVNPLIKVSSIKHISFKGNYPEGVAGVSFHPARAAVRSYGTLLGDPLINNIGYVVIILKPEANESAVPEWVAGNLTATIHYDADLAYGTGRAEYYAPVLSENEWDTEYKRYSFWQGKGYVRVTGIDRNSATVQLLSDKDTVLNTFILQEGETSSLTYMPGYYCRAGLKVKLNRLETPEDMALINIDGNDLWVRRGTKILNNACTVTRLDIDGKRSSIFGSLTQKTGKSEAEAKFQSDIQKVIDEKGMLPEPDNNGFWADVYNIGYDGTSKVNFGNKGGEVSLVGKGEVELPFIDEITVTSGSSTSTLTDQKATFYEVSVESSGQTQIYYVMKDHLKEAGLVKAFSEDYMEKVFEHQRSIVSSVEGVAREFNPQYIRQENPTGRIRVSCPGNTLDLVISPLGVTVQESQGDGDEEKKGDDSSGGSVELSDLSLDAGKASNFKGAQNSTLTLVDTFPYEDKGGNLGTYGEEALFEQILLAERNGQQKTATELTTLFLDKYSSSHMVNDLVLRQERLGKFDYSGAIGSAFVNGRYHTIGLHQLHDSGINDKSVELGILGKGRYTLKEGERVNLTGDGDEYLEVRSIDPSRVSVTYRNNNKNVQTRSDSATIFEGERGRIGPNIEVSVERIDAEEMAYVSLLPEVKQTKTEANFTFRIGIEKRGIQLSPEKTEEMIANINDSIEKFENINEKLGNVIRGWKGACFATSALLMVKSAASGFDGTALARQKVMQQYRAICDREYGRENRDLCYSEKADDIEDSVQRMKTRLGRVNEKMESAQEGVREDGGLLEDSRITNQEKYLGQLREHVPNSWSTIIDGQPVNKSHLKTTAQVRAALIDIEYDGLEGPDADAARAETQGALRNAALIAKTTAQAQATSQVISQEWGTDVPSGKIAVPQIKGTQTMRWAGQYATEYQGFPVPEGQSAATTRVQAITSPVSGENYLALLSNPTGTGSSQTMLIRGLYQNAGSKWELVEFNEVNGIRSSPDPGIDTARLVFVGAGLGTEGKCSNPWPSGDAEVIYYQSGENKNLPKIVPFDQINGWYALVPNSGGTFIEDTPQGFTASGDVSYFKICNIGEDGVMNEGVGDVCQTFHINNADQITGFGRCPGLSSQEVQKLYANAREAIRQASAQANSDTVSIFGTPVKVGRPVSPLGGFECQDFMSPEDCKIMFNVCDPVICPSSRCDLGGKYPVQDVIQTGIIGSIALCLPNAAEGIYVPVCLSGIHAGLDAYVSILKSEQQCLQHSLETGEYVGICDEITAVYKCEFFWRQMAPLVKIALPRAVEGLFGSQEGTRGGGEYLLIQSAFDSLDRSVNFFKNQYAQNSFRAFELRNVEEAGSTFCNAFVGSSFPTSADALDSLLEPDSPHQFYAEFDEFPFTEATVPATSQYKVFYHIYAGNDVGTQYRLYLKNPPASSYYQSTPVIPIDKASGFIARGGYASDSLDFTAPAGYKELCVQIGTQEECGFGKVTTNFAANYLESKYVDEQANATITTEKECISGTPSLYPLANLNIQAGVEEAIQPDISLKGIVRVCATGNPGQNLDNGAARWKDVGSCGDSNLRCWLDLDSVKEDLSLVAAVEGVTLDVASRQLDHLQTSKKSFEDAEKLLSRIRQEVRGFTGDSAVQKAPVLIAELNTLLGVGDGVSGFGSNNQKAEALALKATIYRYLVDQSGYAKVNIQYVQREAETEDASSTAQASSGIPEVLLNLEGFIPLKDNEIKAYQWDQLVAEDDNTPGSVIQHVETGRFYYLDEVDSGIPFKKYVLKELFSPFETKEERKLPVRNFAKKLIGKDEYIHWGSYKKPILSNDWYQFDFIAQVEFFEDLKLGDVLEDLDKNEWVVKKITYFDEEFGLIESVTLEEYLTGFIDIIEPKNSFELLSNYGYAYVGYIPGYVDGGASFWKEEITGTYLESTQEIELSNGAKAKINPDTLTPIVAVAYYQLTFVDSDTGKEHIYLLADNFGGGFEDGKEYSLIRGYQPEEDSGPGSELFWPGTLQASFSGSVVTVVHEGEEYFDTLTAPEVIGGQVYRTFTFTDNVGGSSSYRILDDDFSEKRSEGFILIKY